MIEFNEDSGLTIDQLCVAMQYEIIRNAEYDTVSGDIVMVTRKNMFYLRATSPSKYQQVVERDIVSSNFRFREVNLTADRL